MEVGFIGLGHMGKAIAANLIRAGHRLCVWNRSAGPAQELVALGARIAAAPADTARGEVLMTMLADDAATRAVLVEGGVLDRAPRGLVCVNLATVTLALVRELARLARERGLDYVAAPVFGRPEVAQSGKLNIVASGDPATLARIAPLLSVIGERTWPISGPPERANAVKLAGNFMIASAIETMGEAAALVRAYGVSSGDFLAILTSTLFSAPVYQVYGRFIAERHYQPAAFPLVLGLKDVRLALEAGEAAHVPLPFASVLRDQFLDAIAAGKADHDWAALAEVSARRAGLPAAT